jgi:dihydroorotate dehydrogenase (fumarate)
MVDLSTSYMGLQLRTPLVASASPLSQEIDGIRQLEDAGASAVVLYSLFEEQLRQESFELEYHLAEGTNSFAEAVSFFPQPDEFRLGPEGYLDHIRGAKKAVSVPIIASLNGTTVGGWTQYARLIEQAGADALECNIYSIPTDPELTSSAVEQQYFDILKAVKSVVTIPVAVKSAPSSAIWPTWRSGSTKPARMDWCSSIASINQTSTLRSWKSNRTCCSALHTRCGFR